MNEVSPVQTYFWAAEFEDKYRLEQFDKEGNERRVQDFCGSDCIINDTIKRNSNVFGQLERVHGRVKKIGWYPFDKKFAQKCVNRQNTLQIHIDKKLKPIEYEVKPTHYASYFLKENKIDYGLESFAGISAVVGKLMMGAFPRDEGRPEIITIDLRYK